MSQEKGSGLLAKLAKWEFGTELIWFRKIKKHDLFNTLNIEQVVCFRHILKNVKWFTEAFEKIIFSVTSAQIRKLFPTQLL